MDAVFIVDSDFESFESAWDGLLKIHDSVGPGAETRIEPFRISVENGAESDWMETLGSPDEIGWHFAGSNNSPFMDQLCDQTEILQTRKVRFRITPEPFGKVDSFEIRYDSPGPLFLAIPFEDAVKNTQRFLHPFRGLFGKVYGWSESKSSKMIRSFQDHCEATQPEVNRFEFKTAGGKKNVWTPTYGSVGRLDLLKEIHIFQDPLDLKSLAALLGHPQLNLQFFTLFDDRPEIRISSSNLLETTYSYGSIGLAELSELRKRFEADEILRSSVRDSFLVAEQSGARIGQPCSVTYMLRRLPARGYEIRVNPVWDADDLDPEQVVAEVEEKIGWTFSRIV